MHTVFGNMQTFFDVYRLESWRMGDSGTCELVKYIPSWTELVKLRYGKCTEEDYSFPVLEQFILSYCVL